MSDAARALYLHAETPLRVSLDGPALRVTKRHSDHRRFPLGRLSRVVTIGEVNWNPDALSGCADLGIVVCELRHNGLPTGNWFGPKFSRSTFVEDWQHFLDRPKAQRSYDQWRAATRRRAIRFCGLQLGGSRQSDRTIVQDLRLRTSKDAGFRAAQRVLHGLAFARSLQELAQLGLSDSDRSLALVAPDLSAAIQWGLHPALLDWRQRHANLTVRHCTALFERNRATAAFYLRDALRTLAHLMTREM